MRAIIRIAWFAVLALALAALAEDGGSARSGEGNKPAAEAPAKDGRDASRQVVYVPPSRGATRMRSGGGTGGPAGAPTLSVLAPDHVGVTQRAEPVFAWFVSEATDARIEFTVIDLDLVEPVIEVVLPGPFAAGVQLVRLADHGVSLEVGKSYDWSVALLIDPENRDLDVVAGGAIRREAAMPEIASRIAAGITSYRALAEAGVWYDAIADLSLTIAARPEDTGLRAERAALLEQVGLAAAAAFERENGSHAVGGGTN